MLEPLTSTIVDIRSFITYLKATSLNDENSDEPLSRLISICEDLEKFKVRTLDDELLDALESCIDDDMDFIETNLSQLSCSSEKLLDENSIYLFKQFESSFRRVRKSLEKQMELTSRLNFTQEKYLKLEKDITEANQKMNEAIKKAEQMQIELVSILSIFAAIVIACFGGLSFIGNALAGMQNSSIFKTLVISLSCGIVVINLIFLLLYTISKIIGKSIYTSCKKDECVDCDQHCSPLKQVYKRLPYIFWVNAGLLALIILVFIAWYIGIKPIQL